MLHIPSTNCLLLAAKQKSYKKAHLLTKNSEECFGEKKIRDSGPAGRKKSDRKGYRTRQKNK